MPPVKRWISMSGAACLALLLSAPAGAEFFCDDSTKRYHSEDCAERHKIKKKYLKIYKAEAEAESKGFYPCPTCTRPRRQESQNMKQLRQLAKPVERNREYIGDSESKLYHYTWCERLQAVAPGKRMVFKSVERAAGQSYAPCKDCNPPTVVKKNEPVPVSLDVSAPVNQPRPPAAGQDMGLEVR